MGNGKVDLCRPCMEARKLAGQKLRPLVQGIDRKVVCEDCRRRRFGGTYEVLTPKAGRSLPDTIGKG